MPLGVGRFFRVISGRSICFWGILFFQLSTSATLGRNTGNRNVSVTAESQRNDADALTNDQIAQMHRGTRFNLKHIDFNVFRQVRRQTRNLNLRERFGQSATLHLDADTRFFVDEMQWYADVDFSVCAHALKVYVLYTLIRGVALDIPHYRLLSFAGNRQAQNLRIKRFDLHGFQQLVSGQGQHLCLPFTTINNGRDLIFQTS